MSLGPGPGVPGGLADGLRLEEEFRLGPGVRAVKAVSGVALPDALLLASGFSEVREEEETCLLGGLPSESPGGDVFVEEDEGREVNIPARSEVDWVLAWQCPSVVFEALKSCLSEVTSRESWWVVPLTWTDLYRSKVESVGFRVGGRVASPQSGTYTLSRIEVSNDVTFTPLTSGRNLT